MKPLEPEALALLKAADYIAEHGWCQEEMFDAYGRVCAVGAITMVTGGEDAPLGPRLAAENRLREYIGEFVPPWNDDYDRTEEQVIASLRAAALTTAQTGNDAG